MANQVDYRDPTPNNFPQDYDQTKVDSRVKLRSDSIKHKQKGVDTREAMYQALEIGSVTANEARETAINTASRQDETEKIVNEGIGAFTEDSEVKIARDGHANLLEKERDQDTRIATTDITDYNAIAGFIEDDTQEVGGGIPNYVVDMLDELATPDTTHFNFGHITDDHNQLSTYAPNSLRHYASIAAASYKLGLDVIVSNGDNANGWFDRDEILLEEKQATNILFDRANPNTDVFISMGNHDLGVMQNGKTKPEQCISVDEFKSIIRANGAYGEIRDGNSTYCYKDYPAKKVRLIQLDSFDLPETTNADGTYKYNFLQTSAYRQAQLNWLANTALKLPDKNWQVVIFTHCPLPNTFEVVSGGSPLTQINSEILIGVINAFQNGNTYHASSNDELSVDFECDFTKQGAGVLIGLITGHIHKDGQLVYKGINCIETAASLCYSGDPNRVADSRTEDCWDIFSVDTQNRSIHVQRFGYGEDRTFTY